MSSTESVKYPFYTVQFHPEESMWSFYYDNIPHSPDSIELTKHFAEKFVSEASKSKHRFESYEETVVYSVESTAVDEIVYDDLSDEEVFVYAFP